jgi:diguanylate cyclase (GGDEF)-like protein
MLTKSSFKSRNFVPPVISTLLYIGIFFPLHSLVGDDISAFSLLPVAIAGWFWGIWGGLLWSLLFLALNIGLFMLQGDSSHLELILKGGVPGFLSLLVIGMAAGWIGNLNEKVKKELVERKTSEAALQKSERRYRSQFENMVEGIAIDQLIYENGKPADWIILDVNPAYEKILRVTRDEVIGQRASVFYPSYQALESYLIDYDQVVRTGIPVSRKTDSLIGNRKLVFTVTSLGEEYLAVIFSDITEQEEALQAEREQRIFSDAMRDIASALNSTIHLTEVLDIIFTHMEQAVSYDAADIMLIEKGRLVIKRHSGYSQRGLDDFVDNFNVPLDAIPSVRWMIQHRSPLVVSDTSHSEMWRVIPETAWIGSYLGLPIMAKGQVVGILNFSSSKVGFFQDFPIERLQPFVEQAALALENARVFEETQEHSHRLELVNRVASQLTLPGDLNEIQQLAVDSIAEALSIDQVGLALLNKDNRFLTVVAYHAAPGNSTAKGSTISLENNLSMDFILEYKSSFLSEDAQHDPRLAAVRDIMVRQNIFSILIIPLVIRGEVIGTMGCDITVEGRNLTQEEISLAETITNLVAGRVEQARLLEIEKKRAAELAMLHETTLAITQPYDLSRLLEQIVERATWLLDSSAGMLYLKVPEDEFFECRVSYHNKYDPVGTRLRFGEGAAGIVAQTAQPLTYPDYGAWTDKPSTFQDIHEQFALLSVPVVWQSEVKGVIQILRETGKVPFEPGDANLLALFSSQVAISLENTQLYQEVQKMAVLDPLTGQYNRRGFAEIGNREIKRVQRFQRPLSLLFLDLDYFKEVNDRYGHVAGDQVLKAIAELCRRDLRNVDVIGRYGGEEFVALLLETDIVSATCIADRLRAAIAENPIQTAYGEIHLTVSIGVAQYQADMNGLEEFIHRADQALYKAKAAGRNCIFPARQ